MIYFWQELWILFFSSDFKLSNRYSSPDLFRTLSDHGTVAQGCSDIKGQVTAPQHAVVRRCSKWTTKIFFHLLEQCFQNAHVLYKASPKPSAMDFADFKLAYVKSILQTSLVDVNQQPQQGHFHYPQKTPSTEKTKFPVKRCVECHKNGITRTSRYYCPDCNKKPGLCVDPCFRIHHVKKLWDLLDGGIMVSFMLWYF